MGGSNHKKKSKKKQKRKRTKSKDTASTASLPPTKKQQQSLASRLKRLRGTAESTSLPPKWSRSGETTKSFLTPSDGELFESCRDECYRGFCSESPDELPESFHTNFDECFDALYDAGLFLYDAVQPGGKRLSRTFVTRTVVGAPGSTYRYLGLRLFSHPWSSSSTEDTDSDAHTKALIELGYTQECATALVMIGELNYSLKDRTNRMLEREVAPHVPLVGSAEYSLTLINRMEPTSIKKDLKFDKDYGMGKTSVSWHKDSGLVDFSSIAVYHSLRETTTEESNFGANVPWKVAIRVADKDSKTPPLCVPLPSGTLYYLLDDFNHQHEHTVVSGSNQLRYSSTHRVAREGRGTWQYIRDKCRQVLSMQESESLSLSERRKLLIKTTRAQQQLLDEVEFEWLRQWCIQGSLHAELHPYWHRPMQELQKCFVQLEQRTLSTIQLLRQASSKNKTFSKQQQQQQQNVSIVSEDLFDVLIESMEERQKTRAVWLERLDDPLFETMSDEERPFLLDVLDRTSYDKSLHLPEDLLPLVVDLRKYRKRFVKHAAKGASKGHGELTKRESKSIASNWESMKAAFSTK